MIIVVIIVFLLVMLLIGLYLYKKKDKPMSFEDVVKNISNKSTKNNKRKI